MAEPENSNFDRIVRSHRGDGEPRRASRRRAAEPEHPVPGHSPRDASAVEAGPAEHGARQRRRREPAEGQYHHGEQGQRQPVQRERYEREHAPHAPVTQERQVRDGETRPYIAQSAAEPETPRHGRRRAEVPAEEPPPPPQSTSGWKNLLPILLVVAVLAGLVAGGIYGYQWITSNVNVEAEDADYPGPGTGEALVSVEEGDTGTDIAATLVEADVIKSRGPFVTLFANTPEAASIQPGVYRLKQQMPAADALQTLLDPDSLAGTRVIIPEGMRASAIWELLEKETEIPVADFEAAAENYTELGFPENPANSLEGYLWPGRYDVLEEDTAEDVIRKMGERMRSELEKRGIPESDWHEVLTIASIAEKEARSPEDYGKVARTIQNRLDGVGEARGVPMKLQLDSTVAYATGAERVSTTPEERAQDTPYNTYVHEGLPIGPIANPGAATLDAVLDPPEGDWLYWVTVNTETGETKFAETHAEHEKNVREWQEWARNKDG